MWNSPNKPTTGGPADGAERLIHSDGYHEVYVILMHECDYGLGVFVFGVMVTGW